MVLNLRLSVPPPHFENTSLAMNNSVTLEETKKLLPPMQRILLVAVGRLSGKLSVIVVSLLISVKLDTFSTNS